MGVLVGVVLWIVGNRFRVKHVVDGMLPSPDIDSPMVPSDVPVPFTLFLMGGNSLLKGDSL
jgi:hypothetical protein